MLAPVVGIAMMVALAVFLLELRREQDLFVTEIQNVDFARAQLIVQLSNRVADNHAQIYELLRLAEESTDEGEFYDSSKPRLNEIHKVESQIKEELESGRLEADQSRMFANLLETLVNYRIRITNALLMATVDMGLARSLMTDSSEQYNRLNGAFLAASQSLQLLLNDRLAEHNAVADRQTILVTGLFLAIIVIMLLVSAILSNVLSHDLRDLIRRLGDLVLRERQEANGSETSNSEVIMLAQAIDGVRASHNHLKRTRVELDQTNEQLSRSYTTILTRERTLAEVNQQLQQKIEELNATIRERNLAEAALRRSQRLEAVGQLTGGIAHDFNNLLAVMIGHADLLEGFAAKDPQAQHSVQAIVKGVERGAAMTQRLLAFSRKQPLSPHPTAVRELILGLEDLLRRSLGEAIELRLHPGAAGSVALIDPHQFENALINLAVNARDAMPRGGVLEIEAAEVSVEGHQEGELESLPPGVYVRVRVRDNGAGMPPEVLAKAFEPFFTTKEVGEGSGLGLSMVYGFAKQSSGHVTVASELDQGTTVDLYVPKSEEAAQPDAAPRAVAEMMSGTEAILLVEDDEDIREVTAANLRSQGYKVTEAASSSDALALLRCDQAYSLLFTDMVLPGGMNGVEIAEEAIRLRPQIRVLFTSGYASKGIIHSAQSDFREVLIKKPYRRADLLQKVREVLDRAD